MYAEQLSISSHPWHKYINRELLPRQGKGPESNKSTEPQFNLAEKKMYLKCQILVVTILFLIPVPKSCPPCFSGIFVYNCEGCQYSSVARVRFFQLKYFFTTRIRLYHIQTKTESKSKNHPWPMNPLLQCNIPSGSVVGTCQAPESCKGTEVAERTETP